MTIGASDLLDRYKGDRVQIAIDLFTGELKGYESKFADEVLDASIRWAAQMRITLRNEQECK